MAILLTGCGENDFNYGKVHNLIEGAPVHLDAEYVILTPGQVDCGVEADLWDAPFETQHDHFVAHLKQAARDLKFSDDVSIGDMGRPYAQVRGDFSLAAVDIQSDKDGPEPNTRLVTSRIGVRISHKCFGDSLPMMGVHKGNFTQDYQPVLLFRFNNGWTLDSIVH